MENDERPKGGMAEGVKIGCGLFVLLPLLILVLIIVIMVVGSQFGG